MKQKLLTLLVLLVSTMCAFAQSDATGSGVGSETKNNEGGVGSKGVAYSYTFTESLGAVTLTVVADGTGCSGIDANASSKTIIYEVLADNNKKTLAENKDTYTWTDKKAGDVIKVQLEWAVSYGRSASDEFTYTVKGSTDVDTEAPVITKAEATTVKDTKAILTLSATDNALSDLTYTVTNGETTVGTVTGGPGNDVTLTIDNLTANTEYTFSVTAKDATGNVSEAKTVTFTTAQTIDYLTIEPAADPTATNVLAYYSEHYGQGLTGVTVYNKWEKGYEKYEEISIANDHKVVRVTDVGTWGLTLNGKDVSAYNKLCADVYAFEEAPIRIIYEGTSVPTYTSNLQKGWNHIEIDMADYARTSAGYVKITIGDYSNNNKENYTCLFDNIYVAAEAVKFNVTTANSIAKVVGDVTADKVAEIKDADAMAIDLSSISSIADDAKIEPKHKNAIIIVPGTDDATTIADKYEALKDTKNLVVKGTDGWYRPYGQLQFTDEPGEPLWKGQGIDKDWISSLTTAQGHGWKMTRTIKAKSFATIFALTANTNVPENISVWLATDYDQTNGITFNKTDVIGAAYPYVLYNSGNVDVELSFGGEGDINFTVDFCKKFVAQMSQAVGNTDVKFCGNFEEALVTDGTQWIVKNDNTSTVIKQANGAKISPFRAYFTGLDAANGEAKLNFNGDEALGINGINATDAAADGAIYNLAGQKVNAAYKGIVIKNGKKYIVK